jgi:hypothetical protein
MPVTNLWIIKLRVENLGCWGVFRDREGGSGVVEPPIGEGIASVALWNSWFSDEEVSGLAVTFVG